MTQQAHDTSAVRLPRRALRLCLSAAMLITALAQLAGCKRTPTVDPAIAERVWELTSEDPAVVQAAVDFLLAQNPKIVVPALMQNIDDLHVLKVKSVIVQDLRRTGTPRRRYRPKKFCDLLAALLHHTTGQSFGYIYDGASDLERVKTIAKWQDWWSENRQYY